MTEQPSDGIEQMSAYERKAWETLIKQANRPIKESSGSQWAANAKTQAKRVGRSAKSAVSNTPGGDWLIDNAELGLKNALDGLHSITVERGLNSVKQSNVVKAFKAEGIDIKGYDDIQSIDLRYCDRSLPRKREGYIFLGISEGMASSLVITGAQVSATVTGGTTAVVAIGAISADVTAVLVGMGRIVALVAAHYGYDVREPEEQIYATGVLAYSSAGNVSQKAASLAALSRLTQDMMRQATWKQLQRHQLVKVVETVFGWMGLTLTKKKLAQAVPVAGAVLNGGLNAYVVTQTFKRSQQAYRLRFLTEKYNMDAAEWAPAESALAADDVGDIPLIDAMLDTEVTAGGLRKVADID